MSDASKNGTDATEGTDEPAAVNPLPEPEPTKPAVPLGNPNTSTFVNTPVSNLQ